MARTKCKCPICSPIALPELQSRLKADRKRARGYSHKGKSYILDGERVAGGAYITGENGFSVHVKNKYPEIFGED